jgi:hypothetical protein
MSLDRNILKNLLNKLLGSRLEQLEKRNQEQMKDLKILKIQYKKQGDILSNIKIKKPINLIKKKTFDNTSFFNRQKSKNYHENNNMNKLKLSAIKSLDKYNTQKNNTSRNINKNILINNRYNYTKDKSIEKSNRKDSINNFKKRYTPEPKFKKKKIGKSNHLKMKPMNITLNIENKTKNNIFNIKREDNVKKKVIISDLGLEEGEINFVREGLKKEDKERKKLYKDNSSKNKNSNYNNNVNEINNTFINFLNSFDGKKTLWLICSFLDNKTTFNFLSCSKKSLVHLLYYLNGLYNELLTMNKISLSNTIEDQIKNIRNKYNKEELDSPKQAFTLSKGSIKAIDLLDDDTYNKIFKMEKLEPPLDKIIIVYRIFFQLMNKKEYVEIKNDGLFWEKTRNYILNNNNGKTGCFFKGSIKDFIFTSDNIYELKKLVNGIENNLKPSYFGDICQTTGLVIFIIKDSLEYCGIIYKDKKTMPSLLLNYLECIQTKINKLNNYIEEIKNL